MGGYGMEGDLRDPRWQDPLVRRTEEEHFNELVERFCLRFTKREIFEEALRRRIPITPSNTSADLVEDPHLSERGYFVDVEHPEFGRSFMYPGAPFRLSESPWQLRRRAPLVGEHNEEVYLGQLQLTSSELSALKETGVV
jgi:crotonobetainyl-CoA:carnitine CoA-transferase CaiB-like acyl-CoA transferase